jgi:hypothetical protein
MVKTKKLEKTGRKVIPGLNKKVIILPLTVYSSPITRDLRILESHEAIVLKKSGRKITPSLNKKVIMLPLALDSPKAYIKGRKL